MFGFEAAPEYPQGTQLMFELSPDYNEIVMVNGTRPEVLGLFKAFVGHPVPVNTFEVLTKEVHKFTPEGDVVPTDGEPERIVTDIALEFTFDEAAQLLHTIASKEKSLSYKIAARELGAFMLGLQMGRTRLRGSAAVDDEYAAHSKRLTIMSGQGIVWTQLPEDYYTREQPQ